MSTLPRMPRLGLLRVVVVVAAMAAVCGCAPKLTQFQIVDYGDDGVEGRYLQGFAECYYAVDAHGNVDVVARDYSMGDDGAPLSQVLHLQTFWRVNPGTTKAERTMINSTVNYAILSNPTGATFEGSGFVTFKESRDKMGMIGEVELATVKPHRRLGNAEKLFHKAEISGTFIASRNKEMVFDILKEVERAFGPMPRYQPAGNGSD